MSLLLSFKNKSRIIDLIIKFENRWSWKLETGRKER